MSNKSSENKKVFVQFGPSSEEAMFFRLSSAAEAIVFFIIIFNVFPSLYSRRNRSAQFFFVFSLSYFSNYFTDLLSTPDYV